MVDLGCRPHDRTKTAASPAQTARVDRFRGISRFRQVRQMLAMTEGAISTLKGG
jgi:hypothetical protein